MTLELDLILDALPVMTWRTDWRLAIASLHGGTVVSLGLDRFFRNGISLVETAGAEHPLVRAHEAALAGETSDVDVDWNGRSYRMRVVPLRDEVGAIAGCVGVAHDVTELKNAERTILWQSSFDPLTGALNRARFIERVEMLLVEAKRTGAQLTLILVDIDDFHPVNVSLGHASGDDVLRAFASRVLEIAPAGAITGRVEGDELAIVLAGSTDDEARQLCIAIHRALEHPFGNDLRLTVSIGMASYPFDADSAERLLRSAKAATRHAHQLGGRRSQTFYPALTIESIQEMELDQNLRRALEREEFFLVYQPQVRLADRSLEGFEVLLRWRKDGDVLPAWSFIPRLEKSALMVPVGRWIIDRALGQYKRWLDAGVNPGRLAINVGARQLGDDAFVSNVRRSLCVHAVPPEVLEFEITETAAMQNLASSARIVEELRALGADISIDDFGTGYSSLNYLRDFAITGLKIDRTFVADLPDSRTGAAIVDAMIATAKALDLRVVAEGVETEAQAQWLQRAHCESAQGFLFAKPMSANDVVAYVREEF